MGHSLSFHCCVHYLGCSWKCAYAEFFTLPCFPEPSMSFFFFFYFPFGCACISWGVLRHNNVKHNLWHVNVLGSLTNFTAWAHLHKVVCLVEEWTFMERSYAWRFVNVKWEQSDLGFSNCVHSYLGLSRKLNNVFLCWWHSVTILLTQSFLNQLQLL